MPQTGGPNAPRGLPRTSRRPARRPPPRVAPKRSPVFGPIGRADRPIIRAQRQAHQRTQRATRKVISRVSVPYVPKLAHPTPKQRQTAVQTVGRGLRRQGVTARDVKTLSRGGGTRTQQQRVNRYLGGIRTQQRATQVNVGRTVQRPTYGPPTPTRPFSLVDPLVREATPTPRYLPTGEDALRDIGRQFRPNPLAHEGRAPQAHLHSPLLPGATVTVPLPHALADVGRAAEPYLQRAAAMPVAVAKGLLHDIPTQRPLSDKTVWGRTLNDVLTYPAAVLPTAYELATNPTGLVSGIAEQVSHPVETFKEHPLFAAMLLHGGVSALGRTGGAIARSGVLGGRAARAGSTARAPLVLSGSQGGRMLQERHYSRSLIHKGAQVLADKRLRGAEHADMRAMMVTRGGRRVQVQRPSRLAVFTSRGHLVNKRGDFQASRANAAERLAREEEGKAAWAMSPSMRATERLRPTQPKYRMRLLPRSAYRPERDVAVLAMQGVLRSSETLREDLVKERQRLEHVYGTRKSQLDPAERRTNRINARTIDRVLKDPRAMANAEEVFASGRGLARRSNVLADQAVAQKILDPEAAARAKLFPYAQTHMGARYGSDPFKAAHETVKETKKQVRQLETRLKNTKLAEQRHLGRTHDVLTAQRNRRILRSDADVLAATRARSAATKELTLANRKLRNEQRAGSVTPAAHARVTHARVQLQSAKAAHQHALETFEQRVTHAHAKLQRGEKLTRAEARIAKFDRAPGGRLRNLEHVRADRIATEKELHAAKGRLTQAKQRRARTPKQALLSPKGEILTNEEIHAHMRDPATGPIMDPADIGFITHRPDFRGARAFHVQFRPGKRQNLDTYHRTGASFEKGAVASDYGAAVEHLVRTQNVLTNVRETDRLVNEAGIKKPNGEYFTWDEAEAYAKRAGRVAGEATSQLMPGEPQLVPIRAHPSRYDPARRAEIQQNLQDPTLPGAAEKLVEQDFLERLKAPQSAAERVKADNVVLIPADLEARLREHLEPTKTAERGIQAATSAFRTTVLPFSTKWLFGNVAEAVLRLGVAGVSPHDSLVGRKVLRELIAMDAQAGKGAQATLTGGLLFGERGLTNRRTLQDITRKGGALARLPVVHELGSVLHLWTNTVFGFNRILEREAQYAALGKHARRQMQEMGHSWLSAMRVQERAVKDAASGLRDTSAQHDAARFIDETLGQYSRFSPFMRHVIQTYTPFLPWYLNSVRFVFWTLPAHHPVKTTLLTQAEAAFEQDWRDQHKDAPPGELQTAIPHGGGFIPVSRYTPFGFPGPVAAGAVEQIPSPLLPQVMGAVAAFENRDPFGNPLAVQKTAENPRGEANPGQRVLAAINQGFEGFVPLLGLGRRFREGGRKGLATSTIFSPQTAEPKPGQPQTSATNRILNPFRPVYVSASRQKSASGVDDLAKKLGLGGSSSVDDLAKKLGLGQ